MPAEPVTLSSPQGQQEYRIAAVGGDVLNMKINTAFISQANMRQDFNKTEDIMYQKMFTDGVSLSVLQT